MHMAENIDNIEIEALGSLKEAVDALWRKRAVDQEGELAGRR